MKQIGLLSQGRWEYAFGFRIVIKDIIYSIYNYFKIIKNISSLLWNKTFNYWLFFALFSWAKQCTGFMIDVVDMLILQKTVVNLQIRVRWSLLLCLVYHFNLKRSVSLYYLNLKYFEISINYPAWNQVSITWNKSL